MPSLGETVQTAFLQFLPVRLESLRLGTAFSTVLAFHHDVKFDLSDPSWDAISIEWDEIYASATATPGFLRLSRGNQSGGLTGYRLQVSRALDTLNETGGTFVILGVRLEYAASEVISLGNEPPSLKRAVVTMTWKRSWRRSRIVKPSRPSR